MRIMRILVGKNFFGVGAGVGFVIRAVLDDEVHLLDAFSPDDVVVLPNLGHGDVLFVNADFLVGADGEAVGAVVLADPAGRSRSRLGG